MIINSSNSLSRGESGERANVARSYLVTMQNNNKYTKSEKCYLNVLHLEKRDKVAQIEKIPACSENPVSEKALLQFIC